MGATVLSEKTPGDAGTDSPGHQRVSINGRLADDEMLRAQRDYPFDPSSQDQGGNHGNLDAGPRPNSGPNSALGARRDAAAARRRGQRADSQQRAAIEDVQMRARHKDAPDEPGLHVDSGDAAAVARCRSICACFQIERQRAIGGSCGYVLDT